MRGVCHLVLCKQFALHGQLPHSRIAGRSAITSYNHLHLAQLSTIPKQEQGENTRAPLLSQWRRRWDPGPTSTRGETPLTRAALSSAAGERHIVPSTCWAGLSLTISWITQRLCGTPFKSSLTLYVYTSSNLPKDHSLSFPGLGQESPDSTSGAGLEVSPSPTCVSESSAVGSCIPHPRLPVAYPPCAH